MADSKETPTVADVCETSKEEMAVITKRLNKAAKAVVDAAQGTSDIARGMVTHHSKIPDADITVPMRPVKVDPA